MLSLGLMINELPKDSIWSVGGIGNFQMQMNIASILFGGGVRIGLEDNIWYDKNRTKLASNQELIQRIVNTAKAVGREIATPQEVRTLLNL